MKKTHVLKMLFNKGFSFSVAIFLVYVVSGCDTEICQKDVSILKNPAFDTQYIHVVKKGCGATASKSINVSLVDQDRNVESTFFIADKLSDVSIKWTDWNSITIKYQSARIFKFKNFVSVFNNESIPYEVNVDLKREQYPDTQVESK